SVAHPDRLSVALLDMRRAVEQRRGQPRGPQICGQLAEIHVIVAGDELVSHVILRSMDAVGLSFSSGRRAPCTPREARRPLFAEGGYAFCVVRGAGGLRLVAP